MHKIEADVLGIFDEGLFFLDEEVGVLGHAFVDILGVGVRVLPDGAFANEAGILEVLVGFFEIEELALEVKGCHLYIIEAICLNFKSNLRIIYD